MRILTDHKKFVTHVRGELCRGFEGSPSRAHLHRAGRCNAGQRTVCIEALCELGFTELEAIEWFAHGGYECDCNAVGFHEYGFTDPTWPHPSRTAVIERAVAEGVSFAEARGQHNSET